tara:strand:+ start:95 stop:1636 length:1542 start_codon:yes stop_codon:yes gene_type:complete
MESITMISSLTKLPIPETGVIYRPFKNKALEAHIKSTRERFGLKLLSRKAGFNEAGAILRRKGCVAILFDQNAGHHGVLTTFFGRLASTTELPGLLAQKFKSDIFAIYAKSNGFWNFKLHAEAIDCPHDKHAVTLAANTWLEEKLRNDASLCEDWLWLHSRWRTQDQASQRFRIESRKGELLEQAPDKTLRIWIRMPNWLGDVVMALPLIKALRTGRPDAQITLLTQKPLRPLLEELNVADELIDLPPRGWTYFFKLWPLRKRFPDVHLLFTNSFRGDLEAKIIGSPQRFGMERPGKKRALLTHTWKVPSTLDEREIHQSHVWEQYLQHFGLKTSLDTSSLILQTSASLKGNPAIGFICGTENAPEKRWPIAHWQSLIRSLLESLPNSQAHLFGTPRDAVITQKVLKSLNRQEQARTQDLAGKTNLIAFAQKLASCKLVICNDTGGMHLANALGIPVLAIYGPTNPIRTGPIFDTPSTLLQPKDCPKTGGMPIDQVLPEQVLTAALPMLLNQS